MKTFSTHIGSLLRYFIADQEYPGKVCTNIYTHTKFCNGWPVSFEECKQKCRNNELPDGCDNTFNKCAYAVWSHGRCQLADINCELTAKATAITWKNPYYEGLKPQGRTSTEIVRM